MHIEHSGYGPAVLFLHGGGVSGWMWRPVLDQLQGRCHAIVPDLPGHGNSDEQAYVSHDHTLTLLLKMIRDVSPAGVTVVGFSLGAQLALRLASEHPELVNGVIIVSAQTKPAPLQGPTLALLKWAAPLSRCAWFARIQAKQLSVPDSLLENYVADSQSLDVDTLLMSVRENLRFELPAAWSTFAGNATVMVGARERRLMKDSATITNTALRGSKLLIVANAAHDLPFTHPALLAEEIIQHLP